MSRFFSYAPDVGFTLHKTAEEARIEAVVALNYERELVAAEESWSDEVTMICWGQVREQVRLTERKPSDDPRFDELLDYGLSADLE